jgi:hypothetical protein
MLLGVPVSAGWVDKAGARLPGQLEQAGSDAAMCAALAAEPVLAADDTPVNVLAPGAPRNSAERAVKGPKRHQAVSGYWHTQRTLARWCRIRSYLDSARNRGLRALDAIRAALEGKSWLPPLPALA